MATEVPPGQRDVGKEVVRATLRGTVAAMSMSGMRAFTTRMGWISATPPTRIMEQEVPSMLRRFPRQKAEALVQLAHWAYGSAGGAVFGALPARLRLKPWSGPIYGSLLWVGFETVIVPLLGVNRTSKRPASERLALAADHLLYGIVLSEMRRKPRV